MTNEQWTPIPGLDGYDVSDQGRVRSWRVPGAPSRRRDQPVIRKLRAADKGNGKVRQEVTIGGRARRVSHLVTAAFLGPRPDGMYVLHWNDDPCDNRLENLRYGTPRDNHLDAVRNGRRSPARPKAKSRPRPRSTDTHCAQGHEWTPDNIRMQGSTRRCRTCERSYFATYYDRKGAGRELAKAVLALDADGDGSFEQCVELARRVLGANLTNEAGAA